MDDVAPTDAEVVLSPRWLSQALSRPGAPVDVHRVEVLESIRTTATKTRFAVFCGPEGTRSQYCVKGFFGDAVLPPGAALTSQSEANYYLHVRQRVNVRAAGLCYAAIDPESGHGLVLMDDMIAQGARFLTALEPYTADQASASLQQLARLHAPFWGRDLSPFPWLVSRIERFAETSIIPLEMLQDLLDGERGVPLPPNVKNAARIHRGLRAIAERSAPQPQTLVHGDAHAGNLFEVPGGVGLIDWQLLQRANWALDVAFHIAAALSEADREAWEQPLLRHYLACLRAEGVEPPPWDEAWREYRAHVLYGYYLWGVTRRVDPPIIHEFVKRLGRAVVA
ncbi:MAG: aminoglycoside phosphotransferase family protein, partial [Dehalococcoidia bacterium]|nr:aminoglycoside phosphotransferase family protein [Dehalococcoidia bacterium]